MGVDKQTMSTIEAARTTVENALVTAEGARDPAEMGVCGKLLQGTLDLMDEGVAILDARSNVLFWNRAAEALTGFAVAEVLGQQYSSEMYKVDKVHLERVGAAAAARGRGAGTGGGIGCGGLVAGYSDGWKMVGQTPSGPEDDGIAERPTLVGMRHRQGHTVPAMLRKFALNDSAGAVKASVLRFYPVEEADALPHGESAGDAAIERSQADMEDRLDAAHHQWAANGVPFGVLWIAVDQVQGLRKTHGGEACEGTMRTVEQTLLRRLRPGEILGRWGDDEFLVLARERTAELLSGHAQRLAEHARTADFRWWGDRVELTVSIGASQAIEGDTLQNLLNRARYGMQTSSSAGGNQVTESRGE
jgi:diguanylate cyclase (GGDEF)-like protein